MRQDSRGYTKKAFLGINHVPFPEYSGHKSCITHKIILIFIGYLFHPRLFLFYMIIRMMSVNLFNTARMKSRNDCAIHKTSLNPFFFSHCPAAHKETIVDKQDIQNVRLP